MKLVGASMFIPDGCYYYPMDVETNLTRNTQTDCLYSCLVSNPQLFNYTPTPEKHVLKSRLYYTTRSWISMQTAKASS